MAKDDFFEAVKITSRFILACYVIFLMMGTVSFYASLKCVRWIYEKTKMD